MLINGKGNKQRTVYLEKKATQALRAHLSSHSQNTDQHVFLNYQGSGLSVRGVMDIVEKYRKLAGITKKFSCHSLRHTCATYKAVKGYTPSDLQDLLGHRKPETSLMYIHMARDARDEPLKRTGSMGIIPTLYGFIHYKDASENLSIMNWLLESKNCSYLLQICCQHAGTSHPVS
jgi:site-specific recombinase XerD